MAQKPTSKQRTVRLQHIEARSYVSAMSDSSVISARSDQLGSLMHVHFLRFDNRPTSESFKVEDSGQSMTLISPIETNTLEQKILECSVMMRPDHALQLAMGLLNTLRMLPQEVRLMYSIPHIEEAPQGS